MSPGRQRLRQRLIGATVAVLALGAGRPPAAVAGTGPELAELQARRARAMDAFPDGILLVRSNRFVPWSEDSFRQDKTFYYFTGLENTLGAVLALDGRTRETWLFLAIPEPRPLAWRAPEAAPGQERALGVDHVRSLADIGELFAARGPRARGRRPVLYVLAEGVLAGWAAPEASLPASGSRDAAGGSTAFVPPLYARVLASEHRLRLAPGDPRVHALMDVQSPAEHVHVRAAAAASGDALRAGMRAVAPGVTQRRAEGAVLKACLDAGARQSFWPWVFSGRASELPRPLEALGRYDRLGRVMAAGELVRLDVGCEVAHYEGDVGRTIPVSGRFTPEQRELWEVFVAAYRAGAAALGPGATADSVFAVWRAELLRHAPTVKSDLARRAIRSWSERANVPFWQIHTTGLVLTDAAPGLREGMTVAFEPIASLDGVGYYLEDMYLVTAGGAEILTPGLPTTAAEIEAAMRPARRRRTGP